MHMIMKNQDENIRLATFFELWGCKESYIKAIGVGLSLELNKLDFYNQQDHQVNEINLIYYPYFNLFQLTLPKIYIKRSK
jgi:phosphopantetheinyl transferase